MRAKLLDAWNAASIGTRRLYLSRRRLPCMGTREELEREFLAHVERLLDGVE